MNAKLISIEGDEGGSAVIAIGGVELVAMNCLGYGTSSQLCPKVGDVFEPIFDCLFDDSESTSWFTMFEGNPLEEQKLEPTGAWAYRAYGKLVPNQSLDGDLLADCGGPLVPLPVDVYGDENIGAFVAFNIMRLDVWRA